MIMHLSMFPPQGVGAGRGVGVGGGGAGCGITARKLDVLENLGSLEFPTHESQVCVKIPRRFLKNKQNRTVFCSISQATCTVFKNLKLSCLRSHPKVFCKIPGEVIFLLV